MARAGKVKNQTPKVAKQEKKKKATHMIDNGERFTVVGLSEDGKSVRLGFVDLEGTMADIPLTKFVNHFELDYAISSHRIQSGAVDEPMIVWIDKTTKYRAMYVNITRPRQRAHLFFAYADDFIPVQHSVFVSRGVWNCSNPMYLKTQVKFESICVSPQPVRGIIYGIRNNADEKEYRGLSVVVPGRTGEEQLLHRFQQHKKATTDLWTVQW